MTDTSTTTMTAEEHRVHRQLLDTRLEAVGRTYQQIMRSYVALSLTAAAHCVLEKVPGATGLEIEPSDQGDFMHAHAITIGPSAAITPEAAELDDVLWGYMSNLGDREYADLWHPFAELDPTGPSNRFTLDLALIRKYEGRASALPEESAR